MKTYKKLIVQFSIFALFLALTVNLPAQAPPHPNGGDAAGGSNIVVGGSGGGAPIGNGLLLLSLLGAAYGGSKRWANMRKETNN